MESGTTSMCASISPGSRRVREKVTWRRKHKVLPAADAVRSVRLQPDRVSYTKKERLAQRVTPVVCVTVRKHRFRPLTQQVVPNFRSAQYVVSGFSRTAPCTQKRKTSAAL